MTDWVVTATTIYCDAIEDEVTLMVNRDGTSQCTGCNKLDKPMGKATRALRSRSKQLGKKLRCEGIKCYRVVQYRNRLLAEEGEAIKGSTDEK
jgi:hypothetical protein